MNGSRRKYVNHLYHNQCVFKKKNIDNRIRRTLFEYRITRSFNMLFSATTNLQRWIPVYQKQMNCFGSSLLIFAHFIILYWVYALFSKNRQRRIQNRNRRKKKKNSCCGCGCCKRLWKFFKCGSSSRKKDPSK